jgi:hypothetical protein
MRFDAFFRENVARRIRREAKRSISAAAEAIDRRPV